MSDVKSLLNQCDLSQKDFAEEIGYTEGMVSKWCRGKANAPIWVAKYLRMKIMLKRVPE